MRNEHSQRRCDHNGIGKSGHHGSADHLGPARRQDGGVQPCGSRARHRPCRGRCQPVTRGRKGVAPQAGWKGAESIAIDREAGVVRRPDSKVMTGGPSPFSPKILLPPMVWLSCLASLLPYAIIFSSPYPLRSSILPVHLFVGSMGSLVWLVVVIATLAVGKWARKLFWLWALFPVAFGPGLFLLYLRLFGRST